MNIFLNDRVIKFTDSHPDRVLPGDLVAEFQSKEMLQHTWEDFQRYEKYQNLLIVEPGFREAETSFAFKSFLSMFKLLQAAGGLVKNERGEFLFIHRFGFWDLPKGKIDKKDIEGPGHTNLDDTSACNAAIREVKEETGLKSVVVLRELPSTWHIYTIKERWILKRTRWFEMEADASQKLNPQTSEGIFLVKWTHPKGIHCILPHTYASIRELLLEVMF